MIIYGIYNNVQNKYIYIGQTNSFSRRKDEHYFTGHLDIDKLIQSNPTQYFMLLLEDNISDTNINNREKFWIDYYDTYNNGLNKTIGGKGTPKLNDKLIKSIIIDLKNSTISFSDICLKYNISDCTLWRINNGLTYETNEVYPIRPCKARKLNETSVKQIIHLLQNTRLTLKQIGELFNVTDVTINTINQGKAKIWYHLSNKYPIRESAGKRTTLTKKDLFQIADLLQNSSLSQKEISYLFNISEMIVSSINTGQRDYCKQLNVNFPIRNRGW